MKDKLNFEKIPITKAERKEFERLIGDFRFQDEFITSSLLKLQQNKDPVRYGRLSRLWEDSKKALAGFASQGDLHGFRRCIRANQDFIYQVLAGKVNLFNTVDQ